MVFWLARPMTILSVKHTQSNAGIGSCGRSYAKVNDMLKINYVSLSVVEMFSRYLVM
jgi:hypothetical protein